MERRELQRIAIALIADAEKVALQGFGEQRREVERWVAGAPAPWTFEDTCAIINADVTTMRNRIQDRLRFVDKMRRSQ